MRCIVVLVLVGLSGCARFDDGPGCSLVKERKVKDSERVPDGFEHSWSEYESQWIGRFVGTPAELGVEVELELQVERAWSHTYEFRGSGSSSTPEEACSSLYMAESQVSVRTGDGLLDESSPVEVRFDEFDQLSSPWVSWSVQELTGSLTPQDPELRSLTLSLNSRPEGWAMWLTFEKDGGEEAVVSDALLTPDPG